ncbi:MAG: hypothetical protein KZQ95_03310 [Candidatus Thiodiazotropha sp. (ex Epidulcina cf. delphinae)]|nr:hypothetical protein [Candidatus Thiodiazotropha sp. (ex Epidulcina cf. delphinae)]
MNERYQYSAQLAGRVCEDCLVHFTNTKVALYKAPDKDCPEQPQLKGAFAQLSDETLQKMEQQLLVSGSTDGDGSVELSFDGEKTGYDGGCIEVVVSFVQIPGDERKLEQPEHFRVALYRPQWDETDKGLVHAAELAVSASRWCAYLREKDIWVICGRVTTCAKPAQPIGNVTVRGFDVDWVQDDPLGDAVTDNTGWFIFFYDRARFTRTPFSPFLNFEWIGGPDVYFQIEGKDAIGNPITLLDEPRSRGRQPDREDISNCFCVHLCVELPVQDPDEVPVWTHIGQYQIPDGSSLHDFRSEGYTNHSRGDLAFYSTMTMRGQTGKADAARHLRYRFLYAEWTGITPPTPTNPLTADMIAKTQVGNIIAALSPLTLEPVWVNNAGAIHNHDPDTSGWIDVEEHAMFTPSKHLLKLISTKLTPYESYGNPAPNPNAGNAPPASPARQERKFALRFQLQEDTGTGWGTVHDQTMEALVINNARTLLWLELNEFVSPSTNLCRPITHTVTANYTADHPHLSWFKIEIEKQGVDMAIPLNQDYGGSLSFHGGNGSIATTVSSWDPCSYLVKLSADRRLTNGWGGPGVEWVYRTFCKS